MKLKTLKGLALQDINTQIHTYVHRGMCGCILLSVLWIMFPWHHFSCSGLPSQSQNDPAG